MIVPLMMKFIDGDDDDSDRNDDDDARKKSHLRQQKYTEVKKKCYIVIKTDTKSFLIL